MGSPYGDLTKKTDAELRELQDLLVETDAWANETGEANQPGYRVLGDLRLVQAERRRTTGGKPIVVPYLVILAAAIALALLISFTQ